MGKLPVTIPLLAIVSLLLGGLATNQAAAEAGTISNTIQGQVCFPDGSPAAGAFVSLRFGFRDTLADSNGNFTISNVSGGFAIVDAVIASGGQVFTGKSFVGFPPGGGTATTKITVQPAIFPPF